MTPHLADQIKIVDTNKQGNIQYKYISYTPLSQTDPPIEQMSIYSNPFLVFKSDSALSQRTDTNNELDDSNVSRDNSKTQSQIISPPKATDTSII